MFENKLYFDLFGRTNAFQIISYDHQTDGALFESVDMLSNPNLNLGSDYLVLRMKNQDLVIFQHNANLRIRPLTF